MRTRTWALVGAGVAVFGSFVTAAPAGATAGTFDARCVLTGIHDPAVSIRNTSYSISAPDSVAPGATFAVPVSIGYAVPVNADLGAAGFTITGTEPLVGVSIPAAAGASQISGALTLTATGAPGSVITITAGQFGAFAHIGSFVASDICTPLPTAVLARIPIGVPSVSIGDATVVEGATGTRAVQLPVTLSRPAATPVTVAWGTQDGSATAASDYVATAGTVTIPAGHVTGTADVRVRGDSMVEPGENLRVRLHDAAGAVIGRGVGTGRIIDDDPEPGPRISVGDVGVVEGAHGTRSARFTVSLSAPATAPVSVRATTVAGTAQTGSDYRVTDVVVVFAPGETWKSVPVAIVPDGVAEATETFALHLSGVTGAVIGRHNGIGTILDDD